MALIAQLYKEKKLVDKDNHLRLGQFFVAFYIKNTWPELFYQEDESIAKQDIRIWLNYHHYTHELPQQINQIGGNNELSREKSG